VDQARGVEVADFVVRGEARRSAFGMVADRPMLSDTVKLDIRIRLEVGLVR
jgi:polyisoprenoid-binding protein YceI